MNGELSSNLKFKSVLSNEELKARAFGIGFINPKNRYKDLIIEDIPVMITNENEILCIPKTEEVKHIGVTGATGTLKTMLLNGLVSWEHHHVGNVCINLNDYQRDTFEWSMPSHSYQFILNRLHINPCPTPMVYVFPSTKTLEIEKKDRRFPIVQMTLPIEEAIRNVGNYHDLDKSKVYLGNLMDELVECSSMGEIRSIIEENFPEKSQQGMKFKLLNIFESFFQNKMLNVSVPEAPAFLDYQDKFGNEYHNLVIQTIMRAGFVPSIQTSDLRNQEYFSAYMTFIVNSIYKNQYEDEYFKNKTISLFVDEIDKLWINDKKHGFLIKSALGLCGTNGRMARIGLRWSTQHYDQIPEQIRGNTKYLFISRKNDAKEVNEIKKDFEIPKSMEKDILQLVTDPNKGIFEMVAVTTERFVTYNLTTGERGYTSMAKRGFLIPPQANHRVPNVQI